MANERTTIEISAVDKTAAAFAQVERNVSRLEAPMARINSIIGLVSGGIVAGIGSAMVRAASQAEEQVIRLEAVLKATGNQTGYTTQQLHALADAMAETSRFDDEAYRQAIATVVKFGNVHGETLRRVIKASADLAAMQGTDLVTASEAVGRALAAPTQGVSRLERTIGYLTEAERQQIKTLEEMGSTAAAQDVVLGILEKRIGGVADAMDKGLGGSLARVRKAWDDLVEAASTGTPATIAGAILDQVAKKLTTIKTIVGDGNWLAAVGYLVNPKLGEAIARRFGGGAGGDVGAPSSPAPSTFSLADQDARAIEGQIAAMRAAAKKTAAENERLRQDDIKGWVAYAEAVFAEADELNLALAASAEAHWKREDDLKEKDIAGWVAYAEAVFAEADAANLAIAAAAEKTFAEQAKAWSGFVGGIESGFRDVFDRVFSGQMNSWRDFVGGLRDVFKRTLLDFIYQALAKPFLLRLVVGAGGSLGIPGLAQAGMDALGGSGGAGGMLGSLGSLFGGPGAILGGLGGMIGGSFGAGMSFAGSAGMLAGLAELGGAGSALFQLGAALPGIGTALAVVGMLAMALDDGPENPNFRWRQGTGGPGAFGGITTEGNYNFDNSGLMRYVGGLDQRFANLLDPAAQARASSNLAAYTGAGLRMDGQPAQFAFPEGTDAEAAEQLARELLQSRYGILFDEIDAEIADQIRTWTGTSTELQAFIEESLGIVEGLAGMGVDGLNIEALRAMQNEGETLGQTFQRIGGQWANFNAIFTTEAERLTAAQDSVTDTFADLGIAVPTSLDGFEALVRGLDLTTESGRAAFEALMGVAPAFATVTNAAAAAVNRFNTIAAALSPSFGAANARGILEARVREWMELSPGNSEGWTVDSTIANIGTLISNGQLGAALEWAQQLGGNAVDVLTNMLEAYQAWRNAVDNAGTPTVNLVDGLGDLGGALDDAARQAEEAQRRLEAAQGSLADWLAQLLGSPLSTLTPEEQLAAAQSDYAILLARAQAGDVGALEQIDEAASRLLEAARGFWASGEDYQTLFEQVYAQLAALAGISGELPGTGGLGRVTGGINEEHADAIVEELAAVREQLAELLAATHEGNRETAESLRDAIGSLERTLAGSVSL